MARSTPWRQNECPFVFERRACVLEKLEIESGMSIGSRIRDVLTDLELLRKKLEAIQVEADSRGEDELTVKKPNGRLTEAGIRRLYSMMQAGHTDAEIARELSIMHSSVIPYRQRFVGEKSRGKRRP
jgi:hypothetical protein